MPDVATHLILPWLFHRIVRIRHYILYVLWGSVLPDIFCRVPNLFISLYDRWYLYGIHTPFVSIVLCYAAALLFARRMRFRVFIGLGAGVIVHFLLDLTQYTESTINMLWFPFSTKSINIGFAWPEDSLYLVFLWIAIFAVIIITDRIKKRRSL